MSIDQRTFHHIAKVVGTPVYVYDLEAVRASFGELTGALSDVPHRIYYSVKANSSLSILRLMRDLGAGADIVSGGELTRAQRAGFAAEAVVFSGVGKTTAELRAALEAGIGLIYVESGDEMRVLNELAQELGLTAPVGIRVNPDVTTETHPYTQTGEHGMKFGVPSNEVVELASWAERQPQLDVCSIGMHLGSQIRNARHYREGAERLAGILRSLAEAGVRKVRSIGVGGGLGIRYTDETPLDLLQYAEALRPLSAESGLPLGIEPGRVLVGNAGYLLTRCVYRKRSGSRNFLIVDAGMNDLIRPSLYGAVHDIQLVPADGQPNESTDGEPYDVVGPICESGDFLGLERSLPRVEVGDLLAVRGAGAYGFSMSSTYNSRPRPAEVVVDRDRWAVIRQREDVEDLMRGERIVQDDQTAWRLDSLGASS